MSALSYPKTGTVAPSVDTITPPQSEAGAAKRQPPPQVTVGHHPPSSNAPAFHEGSLPPRRLIRQFDAERALRDAQEAGLITSPSSQRQQKNPSPEMVALATVYVTAMFANTEKTISNEDKIARISEVASFYSEPHREGRFKTLVGALVS